MREGGETRRVGLIVGYGRRRDGEGSWQSLLTRNETEQK